MTYTEYIETCKKSLDLKSDYELAKAWGIDVGYMSKISRGIRPITDHIAFKIAKAIKANPAHVLADLQSQQTRGKVKSFWDEFLTSGYK